LRVRAHGWAGLAVIVAAEACLVAGQPPFVSRWFTPIVWTGYLLLVDALVARWTRAVVSHECARRAITVGAGLDGYAMYHALRGALGRVPAPLL